MNRKATYRLLILSLLLVIAFSSVKSQNEKLDYYNLHLQKGIEFLSNGPNQDFFAALKEFELAKVYIVSDTSFKHEVIRDYNNRTSDSIRQLVSDLKIAEVRARKSLIAAQDSKTAAEKAQEEAQSNLALANKIIGAFYFYDNRFALAFKNNKYGFIDTEGNVLIKYNYEDARQFDNTGLSRARRNNQNYFIDTTGREYLLANRIDQVNPNVLALDLSNSRFQSVPPEVFQFTNLSILMLNRNSIRFLPGEISGLQNLTKLFLSNNSIEKLPPQIGDLSRLGLLDISQNQLIELPSGIGDMSQLLEFSLFNNNIEKLPHEFSNLTSLRILDLGNNLLKKLPPDFNRLNQLEVLVLEDNLFNHVPDDVYQLNNLKKLDLGANRLKKAEGLYQLNKLTHLHIWKNRLDNFPDRIGELTELQELVVSYNKIEGNLSDLTELKKLKVLDISFNQFNALDGISGLSGLEALYADSVFKNGSIHEIPASISELVNLQAIDFSHNQLSSLPSEMDSLDRIEKLLLAGNKFSEPPVVTSKLSSLEVVDFSQNNFNVLAVLNELTAKKYVIVNYGDQNLEYLANDSVLLIKSDNFQLPDETINSDKQIILDLTGITDLELSGLTTVFDGNISFSISETPGFENNSHVTVYLNKDLTSLSLAGNKMDKLPEVIFNLNKLQELDLSGNEFSEVDLNSVKANYPNLDLITDEN